MDAPDADAAAQFIAANARVLDRRRFEVLVEGAAPGPVRDAVAAYANADGGFGHALEPDGRAPGSQPASVEVALRTLDEVDAWDQALVGAACDWLQRAAPPAGGAAGVLPAIEGWPHAPWWAPEDGPSLVTTGRIAGTLHARGFAHPWLDRATAVCWELVEGLEAPNGYEALGAAAFLEHVPDAERAAAALPRLSAVLHERELVALDPEATGGRIGPLVFAPEPDSRARALFEAVTVDAHLDHLAGAQRDDGGWMFDWPAWSPAAERDWRGSVTVDALRVLRANGRW